MARRIAQTRKIVRQETKGRIDRAVIHRIDEIANRVDILLPGSTTVTRNTKVVGGVSQLRIGDSVSLIWVDQRPVVVHAGSYNYAIKDQSLDFPEIGEIETEASGIILMHANGQEEGFPVTEQGFTDALFSADRGSVIKLPACQLEGSWAATAEVAIVGLYHRSTFLYGKMTMCDGSSLADLSVINHSTSEDDVVAVEGPETGEVELYNTVICASNCGAGNAYGIEVDGATFICKRSEINGEAAEGDGYAVCVTGDGQAKIYDSPVFGSTSDYNDEEKVYVNGTTVGAAVADCDWGEDPPAPDGLVLRNLPAMSPPYLHPRPGELELTLDEATSSLTAHHIEHAGEMYDIGRSILGSEDCYYVADIYQSKAGIYKGTWPNDPEFLLYFNDDAVASLPKWTLAGVDDIFATYGTWGDPEEGRVTFARYKLWLETPRKEIIATWAVPRTQDGVEIVSELEKGVFSTIIDDEKVILVINEITTATHPYLHIFVYNADTNEILHDEIFDVGATTSYITTAVGRFYNDKFVFATTHGGAHVNQSEVSIVVVDLANLTVNKYDYTRIYQYSSAYIMLDDAGIDTVARKVLFCSARKPQSWKLLYQHGLFRSQFKYDCQSRDP